VSAHRKRQGELHGKGKGTQQPQWHGLDGHAFSADRISQMFLKHISSNAFINPCPEPRACQEITVASCVSSVGQGGHRRLEWNDVFKFDVLGIDELIKKVDNRRINEQGAAPVSISGSGFPPSEIDHGFTGEGTTKSLQQVRVNEPQAPNAAGSRT
jgi:hypothetical protein